MKSSGPTLPCAAHPIMKALRATALLAAAAALLAACADPAPARTYSQPNPSNPPLLGAFVPSGFWDDLAAFKELEELVSGEFDLGHWFTSWSYPYDPEPALDLLEHGRIPLVTWQSQDHPLEEINAGLHDDYIREWARGAATAPGNLYLRPFPEMNGDWAPWNGNPTALKNAWRRVVNIFKEEGATNVRFVFSPNVTDEPRTEENRFEQYYPGDAYVDILALDGYNWGTTRPYIGWRTFTQIFQEGYDRITNLGNQPVWIAEVASTEHGGDKAEWIREMLTTTAFPKLEAIVWFNEDKETDWRIESSRAAADAFEAWFEARGREAVTSPVTNAPAPELMASATKSSLTRW